LEGTKYYVMPEAFMYFLMRTVRISGDATLCARLKPLVRERVQELIGSPGDAIALAMRILVCDYVGIRDDIDLTRLLTLQCDDGGWEIGWIYRFGSSSVKVGSRGLATALAINAIEAMTPSATTPCSASSTLSADSLDTKESFSSGEKSERQSNSVRKVILRLLSLRKLKNMTLY
jgi:hypothetical protein